MSTKNVECFPDRNKLNVVVHYSSSDCYLPKKKKNNQRGTAWKYN